jgi:hypothetical protein
MQTAQQDGHARGVSRCWVCGGRDDGPVDTAVLTASALGSASSAVVLATPVQDAVVFFRVRRVSEDSLRLR